MNLRNVISLQKVSKDIRKIDVIKFIDLIVSTI